MPTESQIRAKTPDAIDIRIGVASDTGRVFLIERGDPGSAAHVINAGSIPPVVVPNATQRKTSSYYTSNLGFIPHAGMLVTQTDQDASGRPTVLWRFAGGSVSDDSKWTAILLGKADGTRDSLYGVTILSAPTNTADSHFDRMLAGNEQTVTLRNGTTHNKDGKLTISGPATIALQTNSTYDGPLPLNQSTTMALAAGSFLNCHWDDSASKWYLELTADLPNFTQVTVADAAARKNAGSYGLGVAKVGRLLVKQSDQPSVQWLLMASDVTADVSWIGLPTTNAAGELVGPIIINSYTVTETTSLVPAAGEMIVVDPGTQLTPDGYSYHPGRYLQVGDGSSTCAQLGAYGPHRPARYVELNISGTGSLGGSANRYEIDPRFDYYIHVNCTVSQLELGLSGTMGIGQKLHLINTGLQSFRVGQWMLVTAGGGGAPGKVYSAPDGGLDGYVGFEGNISFEATPVFHVVGGLPPYNSPPYFNFMILFEKNVTWDAP